MAFAEENHKHRFCLQQSSSSGVTPAATPPLIPPPTTTTTIDDDNRSTDNGNSDVVLRAARSMGAQPNAISHSHYSRLVTQPRRCSSPSIIASNTPQQPQCQAARSQLLPEDCQVGDQQCKVSCISVANANHNYNNCQRQVSEEKERGECSSSSSEGRNRSSISRRSNNRSFTVPEEIIVPGNSSATAAEAATTTTGISSPTTAARRHSQFEPTTGNNVVVGAVLADLENKTTKYYLHSQKLESREQQIQSPPATERNSGEVSELVTGVVGDHHQSKAEEVGEPYPHRYSSDREQSPGKQSSIRNSGEVQDGAGDKDRTYEELSPFVAKPWQTREDNFEDHIYSNLTYIENCLHRQVKPIPPARNTPKIAEEEDNIYENICDKCDQIFSGQLCKNCVKHKSNSGDRGERKKRSFSDFFNSLKRRQKVDKNKGLTNSASAKKLEIIHNVDGFAGTPFKTNQTFDLQEICALHQQHQRQLLKEQQQLQQQEKERQLLRRQVEEEPDTCVLEEGEVVLLRRKRRPRKKRSGERQPEVVSNREFPTHDKETKKKEDKEDDDDEDAFIATDLNLNSLTKQYEHLVEELGKQSLAAEQEEEEVVLESAVDVEAPLTTSVVPRNESNDYPEIDESTTNTSSIGGVATHVVIDDETGGSHPRARLRDSSTTTTGDGVVVVDTATENYLCCDQPAAEAEEEREPESVSIAQSLENNVCLSVRQWVTSLRLETHGDDDDLLANDCGEIAFNWTSTSAATTAIRPDWYFVKPIPSRTFEEYSSAGFLPPPSAASVSLGPSYFWANNGLCHQQRLKSGGSRSSSASVSCEELDLNVRIDCFKSEVQKNLEQQKTKKLRDSEKCRWRNSITITVKDEINYQELKLSNKADKLRNYYTRDEEVPTGDKHNNYRVTHDFNNNKNNNTNSGGNIVVGNNCVVLPNDSEIVEKSAVTTTSAAVEEKTRAKAREAEKEWKVNAVVKKCSNKFVWKSESTDNNYGNGRPGSLESISRPQTQVNVEALSALSTKIISTAVEAHRRCRGVCLAVGGCSWCWGYRHPSYAHNNIRRNAITDSSRNSLKFQLITRHLITNTVQRIVCFVPSPDQLLWLLKGVLRANKTVLRNNSQAFAASLAIQQKRHSNCASAAVTIMGVLSLVESFAAAAGMTSKDAVAGQNDLDSRRRSRGKIEVTEIKGHHVNKNLNQLNINQKMIADELLKINEAKALAAAASVGVTADEDKEGIYQPIWKFHTVGIGRESTSSDTFDGSYNTNDFAEVGDTVEWEVAEEFEFGSSRETLLESSSSSSCSSGETSPSISGGEDDKTSINTLDSSSTIVEGGWINDASKMRAQTIISAADASIPKWRYSYRPVCILYDLSDANNNTIIYNYDGNRSSAQTKGQIYSSRGNGRRDNSQSHRDTVNRPLLSVENQSDLCESEKLLLAERSGFSFNSGVTTDLPPPAKTSKELIANKTKYVGYECDTPTQCSDGSTKTGPVCDGEHDEGGANESLKSGVGAMMMPPKVYLIPDSVAAWKFMLLDVHYAEDEEDVVTCRWSGNRIDVYCM